MEKEKRNWVVIIGLGIVIYWLYRKQVFGATITPAPEETIEETEVRPLIQKNGKYYCPYGGEELILITKPLPGMWPQVVSEKIVPCPNGHGYIKVVVGHPGIDVVLLNA